MPVFRKVDLAVTRRDEFELLPRVLGADISDDVADLFPRSCEDDRGDGDADAKEHGEGIDARADAVEGLIAIHAPSRCLPSGAGGGTSGWSSSSPR